MLINNDNFALEPLVVSFMSSFIVVTLTSRTILKNNDETEHPFLGTDFNEIVYSILILSMISLLLIVLRDYLTLPKILTIKKENQQKWM